MTRDAFEQLVADAVRLIPDRFRREMHNLALVVEDQPDARLLAALQEHMRVFQDTYSNVGWTKGDPIH